MKKVGVQPFDPCSIPFLALPSLELDARKTLPDCAAIYFVLDAGGKVLYVGQTISLVRRWAQHAALYFERRGACRIAWMVMSDETLLRAVEKACIAYFAPPCNKKTGPAPRGYVDTHVLLPPYLIEWGLKYPGGMGALVRRLLQEEYDRQRQARSP